MKRPLRFRPTLERLEDRWCPSYTVNGSSPVIGGVNPVNGPMNVIDNDPNPNLTITYSGAHYYGVSDSGGPITYFSGCTNLLVTMGGTQDTLVIDGLFAALGGVNGDSRLPGYVSVALDGTAPTAGQANSFLFKDAYLNNNNNPSNSTLYVLGQGGYNNVSIGDGSSFTDMVILNVTYRNAANGPNPGTVNLSNTTTLSAAYLNGLSYSSQGASATDAVTEGSSAGGAYEYGNASYSFNHNNNFTLSMANGFVGSVYLPGSTMNILGGGSGSSVTLGDGVSSFTDSNATVIDLDNTSGGTITVNDNVAFSNTVRFDDYQTINIHPNGGANGVNLGKGLTIWASDAGTTATLGDPTNTTAGTIKGNVTFATGFVSGDGDDSGSSPGTVDGLTLESTEKLSGSLTANLNTGTDSVDVEGGVTGSFIVSTGNTLTSQTIMVGQTSPLTAVIGALMSVSFGGNGFKEVDFNGTVGPSGSTATNLTVSGSSANGFVQVSLGNSAGGTEGKVNGKVLLSLSTSPAAELDYYGLVLTGILTATGNGTVNDNFYLHSYELDTSHVTGFVIHP